ncbi:ABC transporter permease [Thiomicrorhabdus sediminis]|uniref:FtsX-like permease family protein n=1 Tax=Thiomicrorhabdus sediminis TaxID=2580412 RepID=A0A4P9K6B4_9GAMM|nr:FtsX-like permease family protein [Thiomicrorhabdus sediminis]QCU90539.1 FtsX-like permease family protein [Thiomicrorhabdus sediminis]
MLKRYAQEALTASKWFYRSLLKGDWLWLIIAVVIASATVTVVKQLGETVQQSMLLKAAESLGADLVLESSRPIDEKWPQKAQQLGLKSNQSISTVTMAMVENNVQSAPKFQLVRINGISQVSPLRGNYQINRALPYRTLDNGLIWVEPKLIDLLQLTSDSQVTLGNQKFSLGGSVQSASLVTPFNSLAPNIYMTLENLQQIGLLGVGSRAKYRLNIAGDNAALGEFAQLLEQNKKPHWEIFSASAPSEDLGRSLDTAWLFLDLSALSAVLVAGLSILIASRFYLTRWQNSMALMRAFGANNGQMYRLFSWQLSWIALFSSLIGIMLGYLISLALEPILSDYFTPLAEVNPMTALISGFISGFLVLWTFAWQAFQQALKVAPIQILKAVPSSPHAIHWFISFALLLLLISLMLNSDLIHWIVLGVMFTGIGFWLVAKLLIKWMQWLQLSSRGWFRIALSNLNKQPGLVTIQLISVGMVLFVLMLMTFVRQDLLQNWQASLPQNTPNAFVINIQPEQKAQVDTILSSVADKTEAPMVRARLIKKNQTILQADQMPSDRAQRLLQREANIAVLEDIPSHNEITAQIDRSQLQYPGVSVEQEIAELFDIKLGDILYFNISGQRLAYQVWSFRQVTWQSFQLNFFFIIEPVAERLLPISYLSNFHLSDADTKVSATTLTQQLAVQTPGVLLIDVRQVMKQIQDIMEQASWAVSGLYGFTLLASIAVLFTATLASQQSRLQTWLLLRTLGAQNHIIIKIGLSEFAFLGALTGVFAATFAQIASLLISQFLLKTTPTLDPLLWLYSVLFGALLLLLIGLITQWNYLHKNPVKLKRLMH